MTEDSKMIRVGGHGASVGTKRLWRIALLTLAGAISTACEADAAVYYWPGYDHGYYYLPAPTVPQRPRVRRPQTKTIEAPEKGGFKGWLGLAEQVSDISLACRQIGPIHFKGKMEQGDDMFRQRRSLFFKKMQIVRGCDAKRNVLVYMVYSDKLIEGSPKNSTSSVPIMPWGNGDTAVQKCGEFIQ